MTYVTWKIVRTPVNDDGTWDTASSTVLTQYFDPVVRVNTGDARDSFSFKVTNTSNDFDNYFKPQDKITISRVVNSTSVASSDLLMEGSIQAIPVSEAGNERMVRVEGFNFSEAVLSGITFVDVTSRTIPQAFEDALNQVQTYNSNFSVTWSGSNPSVKTDGSAFPTIGEKWFNKPLRQLFEKWSASDLTEDVNYYWYVNSANQLIWQPATNTVTTTFDSSTDDYKKLTIKKDTKDVKNWVIAKGGVDPDGTAIQDRADDLSSIAKHGLRYYIIPDNNKIAGTLVHNDKLTAGVTDMKDATYPFTPTWTASSYASYAAYVTGLRTYVKGICRQTAEAFIRMRKFGKLQLEIEFEPGKGWALGDLIECTVPQLTKDGAVTAPKSLRVADIQYTTTSDIYVLEEDEGTI